MEMIAAQPTIANVAMAVADTEYSYDLPAGTQRFKIKLRDPGYPLQLAVVEGDSGTTYYNIAQGKTREVKDIKGGPINLFFRSTANDMVAEVISFT